VDNCHSLYRLSDEADAFWVSQESEQISDHTFRQVALLILIALVGYVVARLVYQLIAGKMAKRA